MCSAVHLLPKYSTGVSTTIRQTPTTSHSSISGRDGAWIAGSVCPHCSQRCKPKRPSRLGKFVVFVEVDTVAAIVFFMVFLQVTAVYLAT